MSREDARTWERLVAMSAPVPHELERGHRLRVADWRRVDGGVVAMSYQAFCRCNWSQEFATHERARAVAAFERHVAEMQRDGA